MVIALFERKRSSASRLYGGNRFLASDSCSRKNRRSRVSWSLSRASKSERAFLLKSVTLFFPRELSKLLGFTAISLEQLIALFSWKILMNKLTLSLSIFIPLHGCFTCFMIKAC